MPPLKRHYAGIKHVDYIYFNIYNYFYKVSQDGRTFNPRLQTMYLFSLGSGGWLLLLEAFYLQFVKHSRFVSKGQSTLFAASLYLLTALLSHYIFIVKDRDLKIFGKYEDLSNENPKGRLHFLVSVGILFLPYLGLLSFAIHRAMSH